MIFGINTAHDISKLPQISLAYRLVKLHITNFEISLVVFMPNITTNHAITYTNDFIVRTFTEYTSFLFTGLLIFRAVADPRNSGISAKSREIPLKNAKYREIRQKYFQIHIGKTYLILILAIS